MALVIGAENRFSKTIGEMDIHGYAGLSGDQHPIHVSAAFASRMSHKVRVAHEAFLAAMLGAAASRLASDHQAIDLLPAAIDVRFANPVRLGETITAWVRAAEVLPSGAIILRAVCENDARSTVAEGQITLSRCAEC